jgi:hypothetical protein
VLRREFEGLFGRTVDASVDALTEQYLAS